MGDLHDDGCGCGCHDHEHEEATVVTLEFDDGEKIECEALGIFEVEDKEYIALAPTDETSEDIYLFGYLEDEDGFRLFDIESDEEYAKVEDEFFKIVEEVEAQEGNN